MRFAASGTCICDVGTVGTGTSNKDKNASGHGPLTLLLSGVLLCAMPGCVHPMPGCVHRPSTGELLTYAGVGTTLVGAGLLTESYAHSGRGEPNPAVGWSLAGIGIAVTVIGIVMTDKNDSARMTTAARSRAETSVVVHCAAAMPPSPCQQPPGPAP
jgi:hypothetical protein